MQEKTLIHACSVQNLFHKAENWRCTFKHILDRNLTNALSVQNHFKEEELWTCTKEYIQEKNFYLAINVQNLFYNTPKKTYMRKSLSMHVVYKIFFTKQKIEDASSNIYWMYKNCFTKKWLEATSKNTYRKKPLSCGKLKILPMPYLHKIIVRNWMVATFSPFFINNQYFTSY